MAKEGGLALYRKYRPKAFRDVLGQEHIVSVLESAIKKDAISHAYLFAGSRGTGKTSIARIFASAIGTSEKDLYEIDAASNRGIDDVRELREGVVVLPFESRYKVYIIDEVHMLTKEAFNALLKTLEEPPKHAVFILATTEFEKLPETVRSRCESHTFRKPSSPTLRQMVVEVAKKEGFTLEQSSADLVSLLSEGSFRDALGILQKILVTSSDKKVSVEEVERITGAPKKEMINAIISSISESDLSQGLKAVSKATAENIDTKVLLKLVLEKLRAVLLLRYAPELENDLKSEYSESDFKFLKELSVKKGKKINSKSLNRLLEAYDNTGRAYVRELPLELALMDIMKEEIDEK